MNKPAASVVDALKIVSLQLEELRRQDLPRRDRGERPLRLNVAYADDATAFDPPGSP